MFCFLLFISLKYRNCKLLMGSLTVLCTLNLLTIWVINEWKLQYLCIIDLWKVYTHLNNKNNKICTKLLPSFQSHAPLGVLWLLLIGFKNTHTGIQLQRYFFFLMFDIYSSTSMSHLLGIIINQANIIFIIHNITQHDAWFHYKCLLHITSKN